MLSAKLAGAKLWPSVDVLARGGGKMSGDGSGLQGGVLSVNWELDLWGRVRSGRAAAAADAAAIALDYEYARQSLAGAVAQDSGSSPPRRSCRRRRRARPFAIPRNWCGWRKRDRTSASATTKKSSSHAQRPAPIATRCGRSKPRAAEALRALELLIGRYPAASIDVAVAAARPAAVDTGGAAVRSARTPARHRGRRAPRGRRLPPHPGGQGRPPAEDRVDHRRQLDLERTVRACRITTTRCGTSAPTC